NVEQGTKYKTTAETFPGYKFTSTGYDSAPAEGTVKEGHQRVIYLYVPDTPTPEEKKGSVDVTYVAEDGTTLEATREVVKDGEVGSTTKQQKRHLMVTTSYVWENSQLTQQDKLKKEQST